MQEENDVIEIVNSVLDVECDTMFDTIPLDCAIVSCYMTTQALVGQGETEYEYVNTQIDLYYTTKNKLDVDAKKLHDKLKEQKYYTYPFMEVFYDTLAEKFRATYKFKILRKEMQANGIQD